MRSRAHTVRSSSARSTLRPGNGSITSRSMPIRSSGSSRSVSAVCTGGRSGTADSPLPIRVGTATHDWGAGGIYIAARATSSRYSASRDRRSLSHRRGSVGTSTTITSSSGGAPSRRPFTEIFPETNPGIRDPEQPSKTPGSSTPPPSAMLYAASAGCSTVTVDPPRRRARRVPAPDDFSPGGSSRRRSASVGVRWPPPAPPPFTLFAGTGLEHHAHPAASLPADRGHLVVDQKQKTKTLNEEAR